MHARDQSKLKLQKKGSCGVVVVDLLCDLLLSNLIFLFLYLQCHTVVRQR